MDPSASNTKNRVPAAAAAAAAAVHMSSNKEFDDEKDQPKVRRSLREIRKPKFDDEIVDSAATMKFGTRKRNSVERSHQSPDTSDSQVEKTEAPVALSSKLKQHRRSSVRGGEQIVESTIAEPKAAKKTSQLHSPTISEQSVRKRRERIASKETRTKELATAVSQSATNTASVNESFKRWTAADDVALITATTHVCDLFAVFASVRFSRSFELPEIEERWYDLLYNEAISNIARRRIANLSPQIIANIQSRTLYNVEEEEIVAAIPASTGDDLSNFEQVLKKNRKVFHRARTAQSIQQHWHEMKSWTLLADQNVPSTSAGIDFNEVERCSKWTVANDWQLSIEQARLCRELNHTDKALEQLANVDAELLNGISDDSQMGKGIWGVLKGCVVRYLLRSECVLLGRTTVARQVDIDLTLEGPVSRISRKQAVLRLKRDKETETPNVCIVNIGRASMFVDGRTVVTGAEAALNNHSVIVIGQIRLLVLLGKDSSVKAEIAKGLKTPQSTSTA